MKSNLRIMALLSALLLAVSSFASCAGDPPADTGASDTSSGAPTTSSQKSDDTTVPAETRIDPGLPEMDMDGYTVTFFGVDVNGIYEEDETGDIVNDSIYDRNEKLNELYNFNVKLIAAADQAQNSLSEAYATIAAGDDAYQVLLGGGARFIQYINGGLLTDLNTLKYQDLQQPWWYQYLNDCLSIKGKLYMTANASLLDTGTMTWATVLNRNLAENNNVNVSEVYQSVRDGKWTIDRFAELSKLGNTDLTADGVRDWNDQWGLSMEAYSGYALAVGCGFCIADKDEIGVPYITAGTEDNINIWDKLTNLIFADKSSFLVTQGITGVTSVWEARNQMWSEGRVMLEVMFLKDSWRELDFDFCLLPNPKLTEEQPNYINTGSSYNTPLLGVPITVEKIDNVSFALEAMAYLSYYEVLPAYYQNYLEMRVLRDKESVEMLELVQSTLYLDIGAVFEWGGYLSNLYKIVQTGDNNLATIHAKLETPTNNTIKKQIEQMEKAEASRQ